MDEHKKHRSAAAFSALFLTVMLLGACGNSNKKSTSPASAPGQSPATAAGMSVCATCHTVATADWLLSRHANLDPNGALDSPGVPTLAQVSGCTSNCHDPNGDSDKLTAGYTGNAARPVIGCEACHGGGSLHADHGGSGPIGLASLSAGTIGTTQVSAQFNTCTSCHALLDTSGTGTVAAAHDPASSVTPTGAQYSITDTHFATPGGFSSSGPDITGYAMDYASEMVCVDCHNPHKAEVNIHGEWAVSKHADKTAAGAWARSNWSKASSAACQRCKTTTGYAEFANALQTGDTARASLISSGSVTPPPVAFSATFKPEMLKCNGCHTDYRGTLRQPGSYTANYDYVSGGSTYAVASHSYPDVSSSNVCMLCHSARQSGDTIKNLVLSGPTLTTFGNISIVSPHYLSAGGTMYTATGYGYGRSYANPGSYKHDKIGTSAAPNTGSSGPCVGCHMYRAGASAGHLYKAVATDSTGTINSVVSEVCYNCHAGSSSSLAEIVQEEKEKYEDAMNALINQLDRKGASYNDGSYYQQRYITGTVSVTNGSPTVTGIGTLWSSAGITTTGDPDQFRVEVDGSAYVISTVDNDTTITLTTNYTGPTKNGAVYVIMKDASADRVKNWLFGGSEEDGRNTMGAAFNLHLLEHEPGAYVHNRAYAGRLIYDSIDWLDNGVLDYSVGAALDAFPLETSYKDGAMLYLLPNGVMTGVDMERP